ncbi:hypothetical protein V8E53_012214 [Lactarius tabidus]
MRVVQTSRIEGGRGCSSPGCVANRGAAMGAYRLGRQWVRAGRARGAEQEKGASRLGCTPPTSPARPLRVRGGKGHALPFPHGLSFACRPCTQTGPAVPLMGRHAGVAHLSCALSHPRGTSPLHAPSVHTPPGQVPLELCAGKRGGGEGKVGQEGGGGRVATGRGWSLATSPTWRPIPAPSQRVSGGGDGAQKGGGGGVDPVRVLGSHA